MLHVPVSDPPNLLLTTCQDNIINTQAYPCRCYQTGGKKPQRIFFPPEWSQRLPAWRPVQTATALVSNSEGGKKFNYEYIRVIIPDQVWLYYPLFILVAGCFKEHIPCKLTSTNLNICQHFVLLHKR